MVEDCDSPAVQRRHMAKYTGWVTALGRRVGENEVKRTAGGPG